MAELCQSHPNITDIMSNGDRMALGACLTLANQIKRLTAMYWSLALTMFQMLRLPTRRLAQWLYPQPKLIGNWGV